MHKYDLSNPYEALYKAILDSHEVAQADLDASLLEDFAGLLSEADVIKDNYQTIIPV